MAKKLGNTEEFETMLGKLEEMVSTLESGKLKLDDGLKIFEEGVDLYTKCKDYLNAAEKKVTKLVDGLKEDEFK